MSSLLAACWHADIDKRPSIGAVAEQLAVMIQQVEEKASGGGGGGGASATSPLNRFKSFLSFGKTANSSWF